MARESQATATDATSPALTPHTGHVAARGALIAGLLTGSHVRYTKMTPDHIVFLREENRVRVMGGLSGIKTIVWPEDARLHHDDIAVFRRCFGSAITSALRFGYVYRLGPIAEWIFFEPQDDVVVPVCASADWSDEWDVPPPELALGKDCSLEASEVVRIAEMGVAYRAQRNTVAAKRCFMRCYLAAIAARQKVDRGTACGNIAIALANLATMYLDEGRWLRAFALCLAAWPCSSTLSNDGREWLLSIMRRADSRLEPTIRERLFKVASDAAQAGTSFTELLWRLEDVEILYQLQHARLTL
jgi:hypothetical protein